MRLLFTAIFLLITTLAVSAAYALPTCPNSPAKSAGDPKFKARWDNCIGTYTWKNGKFVGEYKDDRKNGQGTFTYAGGDKFVGEFKDDRKNGQGTFTYVDGTKYVGEFKDDRRNGQGTFTWADGDKYVGEFKADLINGYGYYLYGPSDKFRGDKFFGFYENDKRKSGLYVSENGWSEFYDRYSSGDTLNFRPHNVLPKLTQVFNSLDRDTRKSIQYVLKEEGMYNSTIDGAWGKNTLSAVAQFSVLKLKTIEFNDRENVIQTYAAIIKYGLEDKEEVPFVNKPTPRNNIDPNKTFKVASGSGFYVSTEGYIITNHHVIDGCKEMKVHSNGTVLKAVQIANDQRNDLALLKTSTTPKQVFSLSTESPFPLQEIIVAGYPFGNNVSSTLKFTQGIISSIAGLGNDYSQIQIDAALQPGNSGGPILDLYGNVVAVAKLSLEKILKDYGVVPENTNFGVKSSAVRNLMEGNGVAFKSPNTEVISKRDLSKVATDGTVFLSCWMTTAQLEKVKTRKVLFTDFE